MKKIKVLQVSKLYYPVTGGVECIIQQIAEGLNHKTEMKVLVCRDKGKSTLDIVNGVEVHRAGSFGIKFSTPISLSFFEKFRKMRNDCDILHIHMPFPLADIALWLYGFKGKVVLWWHSDIVKQKKLLKLYKPFMMNLLKRADLIMVATEGHIKGSDFLPPFKEKCAIIPFGVDDNLLLEAKKRENKNIKNAQPVFLFVGRLIYYKGCDILLKAFSKVPNGKLIMVGSGPLETELKELAKELEINDRVLFWGAAKNEELSELYANCDVFVLPSVAKSEAFAIVQIEAMAFGKPVINTNLPSGVPYVSLDNITGITVPPNDIDAFAEAMNCLANDVEYRKRLGTAAKARVQNEYTLSKMLQRVYNEYVKLIN